MTATGIDQEVFHADDVLADLRKRGSGIEMALLCTSEGMALRSSGVKSGEEEQLAATVASLYNGSLRSTYEVKNDAPELFILHARPGYLIVRCVNENVLLAVFARRESQLGINLACIEEAEFGSDQ